MPREQALRYAWIGDAVLLLYARNRIMQQHGTWDDAQCIRMTSNQFLGTLGEPTRVEAEIGKRYLDGGWQPAAEWIETHLLPIYEKQEENRFRRTRTTTGRQN